MSRPQKAPSRKIGLREFLRGGYHHIQEPVTVMNRQKPVAVWVPLEQEKGSTNEAPR